MLFRERGKRRSSLGHVIPFEEKRREEQSWPRYAGKRRGVPREVYTGRVSVTLNLAEFSTVCLSPAPASKLLV